MKSSMRQVIKSALLSGITFLVRVLRVPRLIAFLTQVRFAGFGDLNEFCANFHYFGNSGGATKSLDLGCGTNPRNPFSASELFGVDIRANEKLNIRYADLTIESIPFDSELFDFVTAYDFIEHVPRVVYLPERRFPFVALMNEVYRVLKPGGIFLSITPAYPFSLAYRDPTHVNIITEETFPLYFDDTNRLASMYGFSGSFKIVKQGWSGGNLITAMEKSGLA